jgi:hypothetical protein
MDDEPTGAPITVRGVLLAGIGRILIVLVLVSAALVGVALLFIQFADMTASRAFPLAFFLGGALITIGGFLGATTGPMPTGFPQGGALIREAGYYTVGQRQRALSNSVVYAAFGIALIVVGAVLDAYL